MRKANDKSTQTGNSTVSAVIDALKATSIDLPNTRKIFRDITKDLATYQVQFDKHLKKVEEEIARGCRRTKGDIV